MLGQNIAGLFPNESVLRLRALLDADGPIMRPMHAFSTTSKGDLETVEAFLHQSDGLVVLELEPLGEGDVDPLGVMQTMLLCLQEGGTIQAICRGVADEVRRVSGFDRVIVYRFLTDGSGVVEAEARDAELEPFLGLHYPTSDIPKQARELYLKNWIRLIPDRRYTPAPIMPEVNPRDGKPLDLSHSLIRSVSPMHLEFLANMGVTASMSLSIIIGGQLWGLVACHHRTPRFLSYRPRMACELFAQMASAKLEARIAAENYQAQLQSKRMHGELVARMRHEVDLTGGLTRFRPNLLDYITAGGVGLWLNSRYTALGKTPRSDQIAALVDWLHEKVPEGVFETVRLPLVYPPAEAFADTASGLIALSVSKTPRDYVLWFRPEAIRTVTWGGNPNKPAEPGPNSERLAPRKSFAAWTQSVRLHSHPWRSTDVEAADTALVALGGGGASIDEAL